jgi:hypothetical protein
VENNELEAVIAAILTSGMDNLPNGTAASKVNEYRRVLRRLRETGGVFDLGAPTGPTKP